MPVSTLHLEIVTPDKTVFSGNVKSFTAPGIMGSFQILPNHAPFISMVHPGLMKFETVEGNEVIFAASGGVVEVHNNQVTYLAEAIESKSGIDIKRAEDALRRAQKRLSEREPGTDIVRAGEALARAKNRLKVAMHK